MPNLVISFTGLCLFVPDEQSARMHVLLPEDSTGHRHHACLVYATKQPVTGANDLAFIELGNRIWDASALTGNFDGTLPTELADASSYYRGGVDKGKTKPKPKPTDVKSRISLAAGEVTCFQRGALWKAEDGSDVDMAWWIEWTIPNVTQPLGIRLLDLADGTSTVETVNVPLNPDGVFHLYVYHVPKRQLPPTPRKGTPPAYGSPPAHFEVFKKLINVRQEKVPGYGSEHETRPKCYEMFVPQRGDTSPRPGRAAEGEEYTCMPARATLE